MPKPKAVRIEWIDSASFKATWMSMTDVQTQCKPSLCETLGFLVGEDKGHVTIAGSLAYNPDGSISECGEIVTIPRCAIRKIRRVGK